jgi:hypothetical protein
MIANNEPIYYHDDKHIKVGENLLECTGPRIHIKKTGEIHNFKLLKEFKWDHHRQLYVMVGLVGD